MAKATSILGTHETKHIKLGAGRIFRGVAGATFAGTSKFDTNTPGTSWEDLGAIAQDVQLNAGADLLRYRNGLPSVLKKAFVIGREATLQATFEEFRARMIQMAMGLTAPVNKLGATEFTVQASPAPTATTFTLDAVTGLSIGDEIVLASATGGLPGSAVSGLIQSINTLEIVLRQPLPTGAPPSGWKAKERVSAKQCFGGSNVDTYPLLFVVDFQLDKKQFVAFAPKVSAQGMFNPSPMVGGDNVKLGITFDLYGEYDADLDDNALVCTYTFESEQ